jgi:cysteine synthase A
MPAQPHALAGPSIAEELTGAIGNTPLIKLRRASSATGCTILGKAE